MLYKRRLLWMQVKFSHFSEYRTRLLLHTISVRNSFFSFANHFIHMRLLEFWRCSIVRESYQFQY